ncbi:MAG: choice-of-anchor B family protein, partial [Gemmatimonadota bacterium]|nr:choice-of-anchor B family protein [Gemmatimonadota bacterium]
MKRHSVAPVLLCALLSVASARGASAQQFGGSLAIKDDALFVGESSQGVLPGLVYVFASEGDRWIESRQLRVTDEGGQPDGFGRAMAASSSGVLIGAPLADDGDGRVFVFTPDGDGGWDQVARVLPATPGAEGRFGSRIFVSGSNAAISAPGHSDGAGAVHAMRFDGGRLEPVSELLAPPEVTGFGSRIALGESLLLVGTGEPEVRVYELADDGWEAAGMLEPEGLGDRSRFGSALAVHGNRAYVGAPGANGSVGMVVVFARDDEGEWAIDRRITPFLATPNTRFGTAIEFDGETLIVGAPGDDRGEGTLYVFEPDGSGGWFMAFRDGAADRQERAAFGSALNVSGDLSLIGATGVDGGAGAVFVYARIDGVWTEQTMLVNEPRGFAAITGGEVACEDGRAVIFECDEVNITAFLPIQDIGGGRGTRVNDIWGWTDPETGREYAIVGRTDGTSFVDISDPHDPRYLGDLPKTEGSRSMIWRDIKVHADHAYIVADAAGEHGVQVFDLRQLREVAGEAQTFEATFLYDGIHSAHNIVINEDAGFAYTVGNSGGGETCGGGYHMLDLSDPARPEFAGCFADPASGRRLTGYSHDAQCVIYRGPDAEHAGREICLGSNETMLNIADVTDKDAPISLSNTSYPNVAYAHQGWLTEDHRYFYMNDEGDEPQG